MILCDTNILIEFYKGNPAIIQTLRAIGSANIAVSVITKAELFYGARDKQELAKIERHLGLCHCYGFSPEHYPARPPYYAGRYKFQKHFFPIIEDLKAQGEEYECAKAIDSLPEVKYWIRNLVRRDHASFWLPLAHNRFYPDFVCELTDGRMLVVEYKGEAMPVTTIQPKNVR
ncbi:PIN domain-containing protein [Methylomonas koyamae]|uniref:PIN domain-containing protein n=1 Tax=Methylomonas koyamae TaxID=702114 RepID=UPI0006D2390C|nr:PIN domain-containing protein [Methylomonas koyamae]